MDFQWLNTFVMAVRCENFRRAAELLYISQPSVTVHIKLLEQSLGVQLFQREGKKIKLTEAGLRYYVHTEKLLELYRTGLEDLNSFSQGYCTKLSLGISPLIADTILPFVIKSYTDKHPEVEISIKVLDSVDIEEAVLKEDVDLGLSCLNSQHSKLTCELLYKDRILFIAPHDGRDAETAPPVDEEELFSQYYLFTHNHPGYWNELCTTVKNKYPKIKMMKVSQTHITKRFIVEGLGVSFLPESTVRRELLEGRLLEVHDHSFNLPEANTYAIMKYKHSQQKEFLEFLSNYRI
ncbi:LysR family transcriptional regulator [Robertmurraya kyonggiensis]|uniref:LysR family transcriptional regulator n=1 Tax=Robertmurraya kyonggiensis TaxID=1037680 RepID=A0A4U1D1X4_9BACI|nr:LysR family transcriptional regulator [Robertmurraya kyonggiensis]TKC15743.1 LysR family transcriptional regulator [Robertmurraya kyonggiensis]